MTETASANFARMRELKPDELKPPSRKGAGNYHPDRKSWNFSLPWEGGQWTFRTMVEYQLSANMAALNLVAGDPAAFNMVLYNSLKRVVNENSWPYAYAFPTDQRDPSSTARLLQALQRGGIEVHRTTESFSVEGSSFKSGSHVILLRQPYGAWAKTLLEIQDYPDLRQSENEDPMIPYDVTASTLPMMMGVEAVAIKKEFQVKMTQIKESIFLPGEVEGSGENGYVIHPNSNEAFAVADALLDDGIEVSRYSKSASNIPVGSFYVPMRSGLKNKLEDLSKKWNFKAVAATSEASNFTDLVPLTNPKIAIYEPWGGLMDAGWTRLVLEQWELEFTTIRNSDVQAGGLKSKFDIILFPYGLTSDRIMKGTEKFPKQYKGGIGEKGIDELTRFIQEGGTVTAFGPSSMALAKILNLPISDDVAGLPQKDFYALGSLVLTGLDQSSPLSYGLPEKIPVLNRRGPVFVPKATTGNSPQMVGKYPDYDPRLSGFLLGEDRLLGKGSIAVQNSGKGRIILYSMAPQFRAMTHGSYKLLFNAIFWSTY